MSVRLLRAVLFDLDDTLHDDTAAQRDGARRVAADVARSHPEVAPERLARAYVAQSDAFWKALGTAAFDLPLSDIRASMWGRALAATGLADDGSLAATCGRTYDAYRRAAFALFPEALALLNGLRARGVKIGMITNGLAETHREKIVLLELESVFDLVFIADEIGFVKPDPRVFTLACERLGLEPEECAMVGDRYDRDIAAAHALGMFTVWTNVRGESVPPGGAAPDVDLPSLAGVEAALEPHLPATVDARR